MSKIEQVLPVGELKQLAVSVVAGFAAANIKASSATFLNVAKSFIALDGRATADEIRDHVLKGGITAEKYKSARKNAQQALDVWFAVVDTGYADEKWFDTLTYHDFVMVNRACKAVGAAALAEQGVFKKRIALAWGALETAVETVQPPKVTAALAAPVPASLPPQQDAVAVRDAVLKDFAKTHLAPEPAKEEATPVAPAPEIAVAPSPASPTTATPAASSPIVEVTVVPPTAKEAAKALPMSAETAAMSKLKAAEDALLGLILVGDEVSVGRVMERLLAMKLAAEAARDKRFPAIDLSGVKSLERHVVVAA